MQEKLQSSNSLLTIALMVVLITVSDLAFSQVTDENYLAGCAGLLKGDYRQAAGCFSNALIHNSSEEQLFIKRGEAYLNLGDFDRAEKDFGEANMILPGVADLWLARCYSLKGERSKAIEFLTSHLQSKFRIPEDSLKKDRSFDQLQASAEWQALWQNEWYNDEEKLAAEISYYGRKKLFDEANSLLYGQLAKTPDSKVLHSLKGKLAYEQGNYAASIADYTSALNQDKNFIAIYSKRGMAYLKAGRFRDAVNDFNKALREDPAGFRLYLYRAEALAGIQSWESAIRDLQLYLKYFDDDQKVRHQCGEYYYEWGDFINALKCFNRNLREDPTNSAYFKSRGKTYLKTSTYRYAVSDLAMSLDLNPEDAETWMYLGIAKIQSGDRENGCSDLRKAQRMGNMEAVKYIIENCQ